MEFQTTSPERKFPKEYIDVIFIQIHQHWKKLLPKYKGGQDFMEHGVVLSSFFFFILSPNLSGRRVDVKCAARGSQEIHDTSDAKIAISAPLHNFVGLYIATKACIDNRKNLLSSNTSSTCPRNMANFGPLTAEMGSGVWGTPANFNGFRVLAALLHGSLVVGVSQTLRR